MARHDVHPHPEGRGYLLDVQADLLDGLNTRVVVPLIPRELAPAPARRLNPVFAVEGVEVVMAPQFLAAVPVGILGRPVATLAEHAAEITDALDLLLTGI